MCWKLDIGVCFFFSSRRRHTRFDCDWSSDVCSSDLQRRVRASRSNLLRNGSTHLSRTPVGYNPHRVYVLHRRTGGYQDPPSLQVSGLVRGKTCNHCPDDFLCRRDLRFALYDLGLDEFDSNLLQPLNVLLYYRVRSEEHTSELQSQSNLVCRLLLEKKK